MTKYTINNIVYEIIGSTNVRIVGGTPNGTLTIPQTVDISGTTYTVISIFNEAFNNNQNITSVDASNSNLIDIFHKAFGNCNNISSVNFSNSNSLVNIYPESFINNTSLTSVNFSGCNQLSTIKQRAFKDCSLNSVDFTDCSINILGFHLFGNNRKLSSITFGNVNPPEFYKNGSPTIDISFGLNIGLENAEPTLIYAYNYSNFDISFGGFNTRYIYGNTGINYEIVDSSFISIIDGHVSGDLIIPATIPQGSSVINYEVQEISSNAFSNNSNITILNASSSNLKYIRNRAFYNAYNIATIDFSGSNDLIEIENNAFQAVFNVRSINFTGCYSLTTIGSSSLGNGNSNPNNHNKGLTSLDFTDCYNLSSMGDYVFQNDVSLNSITFGSLNPPTIGESIFYNIHPNAVIYVNWWSNFGTTFGTNPSLPVVKLYNDITYQNNNDIFVNIILYDSNLEFALGNENILNGTLILPNYINDIPLRNLKPFTSTSLGTGVGFVNLIRHVNFENLTNLSQILFGCFQYCTNIISVNFSGCSGLTTIDEYTFNGCTNLTSVELSGCTSLATIGSNAFKNCTNLVDIDLNVCTSLTSIGENAFENCASLEDIDITNLTNLSTFNDSLFKNSGIKSIIIPASLTQHGDPTFENCHNLKRITYLGPCPPDLNTIGLSLSTTPYKGLPADAKIYIYYKYSITNPENNGPGPYFKTEYVRGSTIPVIIIDPPESTKHCCPSKPILDKSHSTYKEGQNASKIFTRINESRYSRVKRRIHISQSNFTNICDPRIKINIDINTDIQNNQSHLDNINRLNNSINCTNRKRFGAFLAGLKNA